MVSLIHEGLIVLVRDRPRFIAELLTKILDVRVPGFSEARLTEAKLTELVPVEYQADAVVLLAEDKPVLGVIVEAQLRQDDRKHYTWPLYSVAARARHECTFIVVVVTPERSVELWARAPVELGCGMVFRPHVIGPDGIPKLTDVEQAMADPQLAVLSAVAHGADDVDTAVQIARAAAAATSQLPEDQQLVYSSLVRRALSDAARKVFEMIPNPQQYVDEWRRDIAEQALAEGEARGEARVRAESVLKTVAMRKLAITDEQRLRIGACTDLATLVRWMDLAYSVTAVDELFR